MKKGRFLHVLLTNRCFLSLTAFNRSAPFRESVVLSRIFHVPWKKQTDTRLRRPQLVYQLCQVGNGGRSERPTLPLLLHTCRPAEARRGVGRRGEARVAGPRVRCLSHYAKRQEAVEKHHVLSSFQVSHMSEHCLY